MMQWSAAQMIKMIGKSGSALMFVQQSVQQSLTHVQTSRNMEEP